jgi:hypothetical protein
MKIKEGVLWHSLTTAVSFWQFPTGNILARRQKKKKRPELFQYFFVKELRSNGDRLDSAQC